MTDVLNIFIQSQAGVPSQTPSAGPSINCIIAIHTTSRNQCFKASKEMQGIRLLMQKITADQLMQQKGRMKK